MNGPNDASITTRVSRDHDLSPLDLEAAMPVNGGKFEFIRPCVTPVVEL